MNEECFEESKEKVKRREREVKRGIQEGNREVGGE